LKKKRFFIAEFRIFLHYSSFLKNYKTDYLDQNNTAYLEYHHWRSLYPEGSHRGVDSIYGMKKDWQSLCQICRTVREKRAKNQHQYYKSVSR